MNEAQQIILDHYHNPRNYKKLQDFTHKAKLQNLSCGDEIEFFLKVDKDGKIFESAFIGEGCSIAIASASMLSEKLKGASLSDLQELEQDDVVDMLGIPLTMARVKCAILPLEAAKGAIRIS